MSTHTVETEYGSKVEVDSYPNGRFGLQVSNGLSASFAGLEPSEANELSIVLAGQKSNLDYEEALDVLFQRFALGASKATTPGLADALMALAVGFALDHSPDTQEVVKALVGGSLQL